VKGFDTEVEPTMLMSQLIRFTSNGTKGYIVHVLEIDHTGQVTEGLNTNGALAGCLLNGTLMAVN